MRRQAILHYRFSLIAGLLIIVFILTAALSVQDQSSTWDEPLHLTAGLSQLQSGDPRLNYDHPPLARMLAALPALFIPMASVTDVSPEPWQHADVLQAPNALIHDLEARLLGPARLTLLALAVLLGFLMYAWGKQLFGPGPALLPLALMAFCPPLLANAPIVATDFAITTLLFAAVYGWWRYWQAPSLRRLIWVSLAVAAAFVSKHSALLLVPILLLLGLFALIPEGSHQPGGRQPDRPRPGVLTLVGALCVIGAITWFGILLCYHFDGLFLLPAEYLQRAKGVNPTLLQAAAELQGYWPGWLPVPLPFYYVLGILFLSTHAREGHLTYLLGEVSNGGWGNYWPLLLLIKLPLSTWLLIGLGVRDALRQRPCGWRNPLFLLLPPLILLVVAALGKLQIGIRHFLPALPFLLLVTGYAAQAATTRWRQAGIGLLVVMTAWSTLAVHPYYLMYFNGLGGGPERGWRISIEGDDWGQGGAELARWLQRHGMSELAYGGFGWSGAPLARAGIHTRPVPCQDDGGLVAIHLGNLLKAATSEQFQCYAWMRGRQPDEKIGYSIFLYNTRQLSPSNRVSPKPPPPADLSDFSEALRFQLSGDNDQAIRLYRGYLRREPDYFQARFNLGYALMQVGDCPAALEEFARVLELWPGYHETHLHIARCYRELGREELARRHEQTHREPDGKD